MMLRQKLVLVLTCMTLPASCKSNETTAGDSAVKVVNGTETVQDSDIARSTVGIIGRTVDARRGCTGTLFSDRRHVLTASHCVGPLTTAADRKLGVTFGLSRLTPEHTIWGTVLMYGGEFDADNDLTVVHLDEDAPAGYEPAQLIPTTTVLRVTDQLTVAGYGITVGSRSELAYATAGTLRQANVKIHSLLGGRHLIKEFNAPSSGACHGDSGGPHYLRKDGALYLAGVTSTGDSNCGTAHAVDLRAYATWLQQALNGNGAATARDPVKSLWLDRQNPEAPAIPYCLRYDSDSVYFSTSEPELGGPGGQCRALSQ